MASRADTWMPFYIADYARDTLHLTRDQHGGYLLLLMACWNAGGRLPDSPATLAAITKATPAEWRKLAPVLLPFFTVEGGYVTHKRVLAEHEKAARLSEARRDAGKKGGRPRSQDGSKQKAIGYANQNQTGSQTETPSPLQLEPDGSNPPEVPQGTKAIVLRQAHVEAAWAITPPKARGRTSKADVQDALKAAAQRGKAPEAVIEGLKAYYASREATRDDGEYAKGAHRIIAKDRWESFVGEAAATAAPETPEDRNAWWGRRVAEFAKSRHWNEVDWGPRPGRDGCRVPADILAAHNYGQPGPPNLVVVA